MKTNRSEFVQAKSARRKAFTLLELLVVLGVVAVLIVLEPPVLADTKGADQNRRLREPSAATRRGRPDLRQ